MGLYSNAKAVALIRDLGDKLAKRLAGGAGLNTVESALYTDGNGAVWPYLLIYGSGGKAAGNPVVLIEISNVDAVSKDIFGGQLYAYAPHVLQFGYELDANGKPTPAAADLAACQFEAIKTGVRLQLKEVAHNTAVTAAAVNAASAAADLDELYWPTKNP